MRQQLRTEANAEYRLVLCQGALDRLEFGAQVWSPRLILDIHRAAQHDQAAVAVDVGLCVRVAFEVDETDAVAAPPDQGIQRAQRLGGNVLEDE